MLGPWKVVYLTVGAVMFTLHRAMLKRGYNMATESMSVSPQTYKINLGKVFENKADLSTFLEAVPLCSFEQCVRAQATYARGPICCFIVFSLFRVGNPSPLRPVLRSASRRHST